MLILLHIGALVMIGLVAWWFSGYDSKLTSENKKEDFIRRMVRCGLTLFFVEVMIWLPPSAICFSIFLAVLWAGCLSEFFSYWFTWLIDPENKRPADDPNKYVAQLDMIGALIRSGRKAEAIQLCESLKASGEVEITTLELTLEHLGVPQADAKKTNPLNAASQLRRQGKFSEAKLLLDSLLLENPRHLDAVIMLARLYTQDLREPGKAHEILRVLEQQPHISTDHIEFARRSIGEWSRRQPEIEAVAEPKIKSVDELLEQKLFGSAIELLENKINAQPQDFDLRLQLAEVHAVHCENFQTAEKIIRQIEVGPGFSQEQIERARSKLKEWRDTPLPRK